MLPNHFERIGGEETIRRLVDRFYDVMDSLPETYGVRKMHPADLTTSREKLYEFLVGWMGGPPIYVEKYGHPRLRARHLPFAIGESERDQWMICMRQALQDVVSDEALSAELDDALYKLADFMQNQGGGPATGIGGIAIR